MGYEEEKAILHPTQSLSLLIYEAQIAWKEMPEEDVDHHIFSMTRRVQECVQLGSGLVDGLLDRQIKWLVARL